MSVLDHTQFERQAEYMDEINFREVVRGLKDLAAHHGFAEVELVELMVRAGPAAAFAELGARIRQVSQAANQQDQGVTWPRDDRRKYAAK